MSAKRVSIEALVLATLTLCAFSGRAESATGDWPAFGRDPGGSQYSPLDRIDRDNVERLTVAWQHRSGDVRDGKGFAGTSLPVTPIFAADTLFFCTPFNRVFALDGRTGQEKWVFDPDAPQADTGVPLLDEPLMHVYCRGVAYWSDPTVERDTPCARRIYKGDSRGHVFAIDADTGLACRDFGAAIGHPGYASHTDYENHGDGFLIVNSPPAIAGDLVIVGSVVQDTIPNSKNGIVRAFDARSGELRWEFNPIPKQLRKRVGGGNVWSTISVDPERGLVFLPTTSLSTDYFGAFRNGDSPLTDAVVAVDAQTGRVRWHQQLIRYDLFDYDLPGHPLLVTIRKNGAPLDVAIQQTKLGELFVFARDTGEPVFPVDSMPAPASDIVGENSARSQPTSPGIDRFARRELSADDMFGLTPWDRSACREILERSRYDGIYTPASRRGSIVFPSIRGGGNWGGVAFDPVHNLVIARADNLATRVKLFVPDKEPEPSLEYSNRIQPVAGTPYWTQVQPFVSPFGIPCTSPPWGELTAIDMDSGQTRWRIPVAQARRWGITVPESWGWGSPLVGGPIVTGGGLVFMAAGLDHHIRAFDVETGEQLWKHDLPAPGMAVPMTYEIDGVQYVVIAAGGNSLAETKNDDAIVAFALDGAREKLTDDASRRLSIGRSASAEDITQWDIDVGPDGAGLPAGSGNAMAGESIYLDKCVSCHGVDGRLGRDKLAGNDKYRTVGNHWPYATTLFDYIRRAMPAPEPGSLSDTDVYSLTAYVLFLNAIVSPEQELNAQSLPRVVMPARDRFVPDDRRGGPEVK